jgi:hypothetical protein
VSVSVRLLSLGSQMNTVTAIFSDLLVLCLHADLLRLGMRVLGGDVVVLECRRLQLLPLHAELLGFFCS